MKKYLIALTAGAFVSTGPAQQAGPSSATPAEETVETIIVTGKAENIIGIAPSASKGQANNEELSQRPVLRRGELLEAIPGVIITQHAGGGKANQYFLRGFNLDHGTDFNVSVDGMPINFRTHAHGQGYADINILVPEFIGGLDYFKGPYYAELGDLSSAGGAQYRLFHELPDGIASFTYGEHEYFRALLADSFQVGAGTLTLGAEFTNENGPWEKPNDYNRYNGFARWHLGDDDNFFDITALAYHGEWASTDQVPKRAIDSGLIDRFEGLRQGIGLADGNEGGESQRYSLQMNFQKKEENTTLRADAYVGYYDLQLYSDFTYFLSDPVRGDQFEQKDKRYFFGGSVSQEWRYELAERPVTSIFGLQTRNDLIDGIGLYLTEQRQRFRTIREDDVYEGSYGFFTNHEIKVTDWMRAGAGLRGDLFYFDVDSDTGDNSGSKWDHKFSPKAHVIFGPWKETELYLNGGLGFHSNDARGVTINTDPATGDPADQVDPLVRTKGAEIGVRTNAVQGLTATAALWILQSDSELVYVGDAGSTEAGPASKRYGVELTAYYRPTDWITVDAEYAWSHARFQDVPSGQDHIPGAVEDMASAGITLGKTKGLYGSLRARYFGPRPLEESGEVESKDSIQFNARLGYRWDKWDVALDCLNLFDRDDNDIEYFYESRLPGEPAEGVADIHLHPTEPRQFRLTATYRW